MKVFLVVTLSFNNVKVTLFQNYAVCEKVIRTTWSFIWHNKYITILCAKKVSISKKRTAAKNITSNYDSKPLNDFLRLNIFKGLNACIICWMFFMCWMFFNFFHMLNIYHTLNAFDRLNGLYMLNVS